MDYPKFQISQMLGDKSYQVVVRAETAEELQSAWEQTVGMRSQITLGKSKTQTSQTPPQTAPVASQTPPQGAEPQPITDKTCDICYNPMEWKTGVSKKTNKPYAFWGCSTRNQDGSFCKGKPQNAPQVVSQEVTMEDIPF